jgi:multisubunit Na+/H+ antiporter MnhG subunit
MESLLNASLLVFGSLAILLAPLALAIAIAETRPGGAGWKLLTFVCCTVAAWFFFFTSSLVIAFVAWLLAWACAMAMRMSINRRRA